MSSVDEAWEIMERVLPDRLLFPPALPEAVDDLERTLGFAVPDEVRACLLRHDGGVLAANWTLFSVAEITKHLGWLREIAAQDNPPKNDVSDGDIVAARWGPGWFPVANDGNANFTVVDMSPGPNGTEGQVLDVDHETGAERIADSFGQWLLGEAKELRAS